MPYSIDRRSAVRALGAAGVTLALAPHVVPPGGDAPLAGWLRSMIADLESARRVGQAYLAKAPAEADRQRLLAGLFPRLDPGEARLGDGPASWRDSFSTRCRRDFAEGQTVQIEGWVLSLTEARLCALAALA